MPRFQPQVQDNPLAQLIQLAQLQHLTSQGDVEQQQLEQQDQKNRTAAALQLLGLHQDQEQHAATLAETTRSREAAAKSNITEALISHLSQRTDVPLGVLADTLEKSGNPELATTLRGVHAAETQKKAMALLPTITTARQKGGKVYDDVITSVQSDPEVWAALQPHLPHGAGSSWEPEGTSSSRLPVNFNLSTPFGDLTPGFKSIGPLLRKLAPGAF